MLSFYRGFSSPFMAQVIYKSVIFTTNSLAKDVILPKVDRNNNFSLFLVKLFLCGGIAGSINSLIVTPVEFIRNNLIVLPKKQQKSPISLLRAMHLKQPSTLQFIRQLYSGAHITMLRDGGGMGLYFIGFEVAKSGLKHFKSPREDTKPALIDLILCGATAGIVFWSYALPFDFVKTRVQINAFSGSTTPPRLLHMLRKHSLTDLYKGWQVALGRGAPGAAATMTVYTYSREYLN